MIQSSENVGMIYRVTNKLDGKVYIGKWQGNRVEDRWSNHKSAAKRGAPNHFHRAIRKYGSDAFTIEAIYFAKTLYELSCMETFFIFMHQSHKSIHGYNMTLGGDGGTLGLKWTEEQRKHMSDLKRGENNPNFGKPRTPETKQKIRESKLGSKNPNFGKVWSEERKQEASAVMSGSGNPRFGTGHIPIEKVCPNCSDLFTVSYSNRRVVCCSPSCATAWRYKKNPEARKEQSLAWTPEKRKAQAERNRKQEVACV